MGLGGGGDRSASGSFGIEAVLILATIGGGLAYAVRSPVYALYKRLTAPRAHPRSVAEAREGELCAIEGTVHPTEEELTTSPCGTPCVAYAVEVEVLVTKGKSTMWVPHVEEERGVDFLLEDGSGKARVHGAKASITRAGRWNESLVPAVSDFIARVGETTAGALRWREHRIEVGSRVRITGIAQWRDAKEGYRGAGRQLVIDAPDLGWIAVSHLRS